MCELLSWDATMHYTNEWNEGVYALNEEEVDAMLSSSLCSLGDDDTTDCSLGATSDTNSCANSSLEESVTAPSTPAPKRKVLATPPCAHNSWDNIRAKRGCMTLRCRECQQKWKIEAICLKRCRTFASGNCRTPDCQKTHIHRYKQTAESKEE